jgi:hypothetical protein
MKRPLWMLAVLVMLAASLACGGTTATAPAREQTIELPTELPTNTPVLPTDVPELPTNTPVPPTVAPTNPPGPRVIIASVNKRDEYVEIRNSGDAAQDLAGWTLISEKGNQQCPLSGVLDPGQTLRIWAMDKDRDQGGLNCGFMESIWNNDDPDPAVLLDGSGHEVDRN